MIDRLKKPLGFACPAGHLDKGEEPEDAIIREVEEETGLIVKSLKRYDIDYLMGNFDDCPQETCSRGISQHFWYVYEVEAEGDLILKLDEVKSIDWYSVEEIKNLKLESVWEYWLKKIFNNELKFK